MKKNNVARNCKTENIRQNNCGLILNVTTLGEIEIRALRYFRIVQTADSLESYKRVRNENKELIKSKKSQYAVERGIMLSEADQDKNPKAFWNFLKADRKAPVSEIKLDDWVEFLSYSKSAVR